MENTQIQEGLKLLAMDQSDVFFVRGTEASSQGLDNNI